MPRGFQHGAYQFGPFQAGTGWLDVLGKLILELRASPDVDAFVHGRVRGFEAAKDDARGPTAYQAFIVLLVLATPREKRIALQRPRIAGRFYGRTPQEAMALYGAASDTIHHAGPRVYSNGLGIWDSWDETGATAEKDPDTGQPYVTAIFELVATTEAVA